MKNWLGRLVNKNTDPVKFSFFSIMGTAVFGFILAMFATRGACLTSLLFWLNNDTNMDYFNSVYGAVLDPYQRGQIYPPLAHGFYVLLAHMTPQAVVELPPFALRNTFHAQGLFQSLTAIINLTLALQLFHHFKGARWKRIAFVSMIFLSAPFLFQLQRANIIIVALLFLIAFMFGKDSENKFIRELSYIALAVAAAIKVYPALFGLLLLKDKQWKPALRCAIYGVVLLLGPFVFFGGFSQIPVWLHNMQAYIDVQSNFGFGFQVNFSNLITLLFQTQGISGDSVTAFATGVTNALFVLGLGSTFFLKKWKPACLLGLLCVGFPNFSYTYTLIFMFVPLIFFLQERARTPIDWAYLPLFLGMMMPLAIGSPDMLKMLPGEMRVSISALTQSFSVLMMTILLIGEGIKGAAAWAREKVEQRKGALATASASSGH